MIQLLCIRVDLDKAVIGTIEASACHNADKEFFQVEVITASGIWIERPIGLVEQVDVRVANNGRFLFKIKMSTDDARSLKQEPGEVTANLNYDLNLKEGTK